MGSRGNRNAVRTGVHTALARERRRAIRALLAEAKWAIAAAQPFLQDRIEHYEYITLKDGREVRRLVYEVRRVRDEAGRLQRKWVCVYAADKGCASKIAQRILPNPLQNETVGRSAIRSASGCGEGR